MFVCELTTQFGNFTRALAVGSILLLSGCGGGSSAPTSAVNEAPVVDAGSDQTVGVAVQVMLTGTAADTDGSISSVQWQLVEGDADITLQNSDTLSASFLSPTFSGDFLELVFELKAVDNDGASATDTVKVTISSASITANAGTNQNVDEESFVSVSGSAFSLNNITTAVWSQTAGNHVAVINNPNSLNLTFNAPVLDPNTASDTLIFELTIMDDQGLTASDTVEVMVNDINNRAPEIAIPNVTDIAEGAQDGPNFSVSDGDTTGEAINLSLSGRDAVAFTIVDGQQIQFVDPPDYNNPVCSDNSCQLTIEATDGVNTGSEQIVINVTEVPDFIYVNDTGITFSGFDPLIDGENDEFGNATSCVSNVLGAPQDCDLGRDSLNADDKEGAGTAGFDFTKLDSTGTELAIQSSSYDANGTSSAGTLWSCVRDNQTELVWQVHTLDGSQYDSVNRYTPGAEDLVAKANADSLCGFNDWRVPGLFELHNLVVRHQQVGSKIDTDYFPNTQSVDGLYWSATMVPNNPSNARLLDFTNGTDLQDFNSQTHSVRLVRGGDALNRADDTRYTLNGDGTVTDNVTQLMWQRCYVGSTFNQGTCEVSNNVPETFLGWQDALQEGDTNQFAGYSDWRVPNVNELASIIRYAGDSSPGSVTRFVNPSVFPLVGAGSQGSFQTSSPAPAPDFSDSPIFSRIWIVNFITGTVFIEGRAINYDDGGNPTQYLLLVRDVN